jgi:hypothetical protein
VKDILYTAKDSGISKVEFSIGAGKLVLTSGSEVELNEENVDGITATIVNDTTSMSSISLDWNTDDDMFITEDSSLVMPGFETIQILFGGLDYPAEEDIMIEFSADEELVLRDFPMKSGEADIQLLYSDNTDIVGLGEAADNALVTSDYATNSITLDNDAKSPVFIASYNDGSDAESYLMRVTNFDDNDPTNKTDVQYYKNGVWTDVKTGVDAGDSVDIGEVELTMGAINVDLETATITNATANTRFDRLYSVEGLEVYLPVNSATLTGNGIINLTAGPDSWNLTFVEENEDGDIGSGDTIRATIGHNSQTPAQLYVSTVWGGEAGQSEIDDSDVYRDFVYSALATEILFDKGPDQQTLKLIYHGDEVAADVYITSTDVVVSDGGESGVMTVTDSNVASVSGKNLIVVGGSAINSVAAELLGGAYRTEEFTSMTGVGAGEFLIQSFDRNGETALLVAGYNAADTTKAATYLINEGVDTTVGNKYTGSSATSATLVTTQTA